MKFVKTLFIFLISALLFTSQSTPSLTALAYGGNFAAGEFTSAKRITIYGDTLVVTDGGSTDITTPNQIQIIDKTKLEQSDCAYNIGVFGAADNGLVNPLISLTDSNSIYVYYNYTNTTAGPHHIKQFDMAGNVIKPSPTSTSFTEVNNLNQYFNSTEIDNNNLKTISDMTVDSFGNIYAAMSWNKNATDYGALIKKTLAGFEMVNIDTTLLSAVPLIQSNSRLFPSSDTNNLIVVTDTTVITIDTTLGEVVDKIDINIPFDDINTDYKDNLYFYEYGGTYTHTLTKLSAPNYNLPEVFDIGSSNATIPNDKIDNNIQMHGFTFDKVTADGYFLMASNIATIDLSDIVDNLRNFEKPDYTQQVMLDSPIEIMKLKNTATSYAYPYAISPEQNFDTNDFVFVLGEENNFKYCLVTNQENYNFTTYIHKNNLTAAATQTISNPNMITFINAKRYKFPSSLKTRETIISPLMLGDIPSNTKIKAVRLLEDYKDFLNASFYEIETIDHKYYYVNTLVLTSYNKDATAEFIRSNAAVNITDGSAIAAIYDAAGGTVIYSLQHGTRIKVVGNIDRNQEYTLIEYLDQTDNVAQGYIKTKYIEMDGIKTEIIIAIILAIAAAILAVVLIAVSKKNNK
ncbi:MAG: hypothetical protein LBN07_02415 [Christensenellaceae bacterium]|jgi:hypothetical protein|nr:hypothetical protein [Christensenellaceae bacterium]